MKTPKVTESVVKRVQRAGYEQPRHGKCIICSGNWDDCSHNREQVANVIACVRIAEGLGLTLPK